MWPRCPSVALGPNAAVAAVDAKPASYLLHVGPAMEAGVTNDQVHDVLVAVAPIVGTARVMSASLAITEALGVAITIVEDALDSAMVWAETAGRIFGPGLPRNCSDRKVEMGS